MNHARLAVAILAAAGVILSASFVSQIRHYILDTFPGHFILIFGGVVGGSVALALLVAVIRIRDRRLFRYACIVAALAMGTLYSIVTSSPEPQVAAVERFHFLQYGVLTFLFYRAWRPLDDAGVLMLPVLAAMLTATVEEWFQWFIPGRVGTVDDVFLNWVAILCGLLFSIGLDPPDRLTGRLTRRSLRHVGLTSAVFVIVFGMFFDSVHVGHRIADRAIGSFDSLYTTDELHAEAKDRARRWPANPPIDKTRIAPEDQYRTEGVQHVRARNLAWERGDIDASWRENMILETFYAPVLDTGHRWPAEQRRDAEQRFASGRSNGEGYVSTAYPYRVYDWPAWKFWLAVLAVAGAVPTITSRAARDPA